jgi:hypothetical protein
VILTTVLLHLRNGLLNNVSVILLIPVPQLDLLGLHLPVVYLIVMEHLLKIEQIVHPVLHNQHNNQHHNNQRTYQPVIGEYYLFRIVVLAVQDSFYPPLPLQQPLLVKIPLPSLLLALKLSLVLVTVVTNK